jgi:hypothetical protein
MSDVKMQAKEAIGAELLKLVKRPALDEKGKPKTRKENGEEVPVMRGIGANEVHAWRATETHVHVTTIDGQKFSAEKPAEPAKAAA